jgi:hypothetical protein
MNYQLSGLDRFTLWRFRRRLGGGVEDGASRQDVLAKLGEPSRRRADDGQEVWCYAVGQTKHIDFSYSVLFDGDHVYSSWWTESRRDSQDGLYDHAG